jgi:hypothetical protein
MRTALFIVGLLVTLILSPGCKEAPKSASSNTPPPINFAGRSTYRECAMTTPLTGRWEAGISHGYFSDVEDKEYDFLEITLEQPQGDGNILVPFEAAYSLESLPADILSKSPEEIVSFDEAARSVTFDLGTTQVTTPIPSP